VEKKETGPDDLYNCAICRKQVTRRKSYALDKDRRACRCHPGVDVVVIAREAAAYRKGVKK
jgi:hypothetical protein